MQREYALNFNKKLQKRNIVYNISSMSLSYFCKHRIVFLGLSFSKEGVVSEGLFSALVGSARLPTVVQHKSVAVGK